MNTFPSPPSTLSILRNKILVPLSSIVRLEADKNYTYIILNDGRRLMTSRNLGSYQTELPESFVRVNKGCFLNLYYLSRRQGRQLLLSDGSVIPLARRKIKLLKSLPSSFV
ncbi:two-component system LytT family response regulator [Runella defluvii]|uniref:Two-component system LytT family response regulator n=1 Tax=Runella defluvii TaxID=370973 RepID=A0A7W5ZRY9_9BACT|nr:LytTR family transcriptional regulator DNA-binding domain-containing protein [Runella defluvii]MBB3840559.1 two-component system LytT family response regulator [Runella defluvii]